MVYHTLPGLEPMVYHTLPGLEPMVYHTLPGMEPMVYHTRCEHTNHYTTDAVKFSYNTFVSEEKMNKK